MSRVNRYGKNEWKRKMLSFLFILFILVIFGAIGGGGYVLLKPKYNAYKQEQTRKKQEEELVKAREEEERKKAESEKNVSEEKMQKESEEGKNKDQIEKTKTEVEKSIVDYILPNSNREYLSNSDVKILTLREINYAKNEIYARHGRKFKSPELQRYFGSKSWYSGSVEPDSFSTTVFNDYEQKNVEFLSAVEESMSPNGYELDK